LGYRNESHGLIVEAGEENTKDNAETPRAQRVRREEKRREEKRREERFVRRGDVV
jgi:hypothetical protein